MNGYGTSPLELLACEAMLNGIVYCDEFVYSASWIANTATELGAGNTVEVQIQINGDSDFVAQMQNLTAVVDDQPIYPNYLLTVTRSGSGREVMSGPQHVANVCGAYIGGSGSQAFGPFNYPASKPMPGLIQGKNTLSVKLQNLTASVPDRVDFSLVGFKVFYLQNPDGSPATRQQVFHVL